jgi:enoyl-CoA hydratase/carnithine racemase
MAVSDDISIRIEGKAGRITLTRPDVLNALSAGMAAAMEEALTRWQEDDAVELVVIDAQGDKAFCAGGDVEDLYASGRAGDFEYGRKFWSDEYRLNALIANYPKPYVAFLQGFTMGGGVGIGCHGFFRIVCENSQIAMPECQIGLVPDVGGSFLLANAPGRMGDYLGLAGIRMNPSDAIFAGFADTYVPYKHWEALKAELCESGDPDIVDDYAEEIAPSALLKIRKEVDKVFKPSSLLNCLAGLEASEAPWAVEAAKLIRRACPLSVACAFDIIRRARSFKQIERALELEYRFTSRSISDGEFLEGIRAQVIDKDRKPDWRIKRIEDVTPEKIAEMLAPVVPQQVD